MVPFFFSSVCFYVKILRKIVKLQKVHRKCAFANPVNFLQINRTFFYFASAVEELPEPSAPLIDFKSLSAFDLTGEA